MHLLSADLTTLLCFSTVHIVGSLLFKLPSINPTDLAHRVFVGVTPAESPQLQGSEFSHNSKALDPSTRTTPGDATVGDVGASGGSRGVALNGLENEPLEGGGNDPSEN